MLLLNEDNVVTMLNVVLCVYVYYIIVIYLLYVY